MSRYIISVSGGKASAISAMIADEQNLDYVCIFADTLIEDIDLYRFNRDVEAALGQRFITLTDGRDPWDVFGDVKYIGNSRIAQCSRILKTEQVQKWISEWGRPDDKLVLGIDLFESERLTRAQKNYDIEVTSLLIDNGVSPAHFDRYLARYNIREPRLYAMGFLHNNCGGFCVRAGLKQFEKLLVLLPEVFAYHERRMNEAMAANPKARPFLRKNINGVTHYITLTQFRKEYESGKMEIGQYDLMNGCGGCFINEPIIN